MEDLLESSNNNYKNIKKNNKQTKSDRIERMKKYHL